MSKIVVTGATGVLGSDLIKSLQLGTNPNLLLVSRNRHKLNTYSPLKSHPDSPWQRVDLVSGEGLTQALVNAQTVIHLASDTATVGGEPVDVLAMRNLLSAAQRAEVGHLIYMSIVGIDHIPFRYYQAKLAAEHLLQRSGVPYTILRATQFHNFIDYLLTQLYRLPVGLVPKPWKAQPISVEAVASQLRNLTQAGPQNKRLNTGGPQVLDLGTMAQTWQRHQLRIKPTVSLPLIGKLMHSFTQGFNTCPEIDLKSQTWEEYLTTHRVSQP